MKKSTIIILTIISTILSLTITLASYFGITRYFKIKFSNSSDNLIENYHKLEKHDDSRIVVSVSTTIENINNIRPMINSILDQTVKVSQIYLVLENNKDPKIPEYLKNIVNICLAGKNYGEGTSIVPLLLNEKECDTTIIALKDNVIYGKDYLQILLEERDKNPNKILYDNKKYSILFKPEYYDCNIINRKTKKYNLDWFLNKSQNKVVIYNENYGY